jgi:hypothetical protein
LTSAKSWLRPPVFQSSNSLYQDYEHNDPCVTYYRNYVAHDGSRITERIANRILIIESELLELIDAAELTLVNAGGLEALVRVGSFGDSARLSRLLHLLEGYTMPEEKYDGLFEDLAYSGFGESELHAAMSLRLVEMHST